MTKLNFVKIRSPQKKKKMSGCGSHPTAQQYKSIKSNRLSNKKNHTPACVSHSQWSLPPHPTTD